MRKSSDLALRRIAGEVVRLAFRVHLSRGAVQFSRFVSFLRGEPKPKVRILVWSRKAGLQAPQMKCPCLKSIKCFLQRAAVSDPLLSVLKDK